MPTLSDLRAVCAAYHGKTTGDLTVNSVDLFLFAANNARLQAEMNHNFEYARARGELVISSVDGADISDVTITSGPETGFSFREIVTVSTQRADGMLIPVDFTRADIGLEQDRYELELSDDMGLTNRYPSDAQVLARGGAGKVVQRGTNISLHPRDSAMTPTTLIVDGYARLEDYTASNYSDIAPTDFFLDYGGPYMMWAIVCELNYLFKTWTPRTEGNLSPPEQAREQAYQNFVLWDSYQVDANITRQR